MTDVKETAERISTERLEEIAAEYREMASAIASDLQDGPGAASAFYMSCSLHEVASMATELLASRHADTQEGGEASDTKNTVSDERLVIEPGYTTSFDTAINCLRDEAKECDRTNRVGRMSMLNAIANELVELQSLRASIPGGVGVKGSDDLLFITIQDAYLRGLDWGRKYSSTEEEELKASYDYADKTVSALDLSPAEGEPVAWRWRSYGQEWRHGPKKPADGCVGSFEYGWEEEPLFAAPSNPVVSDAPTHRHKKRGTEYVLIGIGKMQAEDWHTTQLVPQGAFMGEVLGPSVDMREVAIYRSATDPTEIWVRPREEFEDGRFEALSVNPQSGSDKP